MPTPRRPRRHWKHSRFVESDDFIWARPTLFNERMRLPGEPVDKEELGRVKLRRFHKARRIEAVFVPPVPKDPRAPSAAEREAAAAAPAAPKKEGRRKAA